MATLPSPNDYATSAEFFTAYNDYRRQVDAEQSAALLAELGRIGARTTVCPCGYTPFDTCPACD